MRDEKDARQFTNDERRRFVEDPELQQAAARFASRLAILGIEILGPGRIEIATRYWIEFFANGDRAPIELRLRDSIKIASAGAPAEATK